MSHCLRTSLPRGQLLFSSHRDILRWRHIPRLFSPVASVVSEISTHIPSNGLPRCSCCRSAVPRWWVLKLALLDLEIHASTGLSGGRHA